MPITAIDDSVLTRFRKALDKMYGEPIDRVVLFGSRARGDARADSGYDVAIFLKSLPDRWAELGKVLKSHYRVHTEFLRVTKIDQRVAPDLRIFLSQTYNLKSIADCENWS